MCTNSDTHTHTHTHTQTHTEAWCTPSACCRPLCTNMSSTYHTHTHTHTHTNTHMLLRRAKHDMVFTEGSDREVTGRPMARECACVCVCAGAGRIALR